MVRLTFTVIRQLVYKRDTEISRGDYIHVKTKTCAMFFAYI